MRSRMTMWLAAFWLVCGCTLCPLWAEDWPSWRGPRGDGTSVESPVPLRWSARENVAWKTPLPGKGHASPIVFEDRVFLITAIGEERCLVALNRKSGKILWQQTVITSPLEKKHEFNSHASSTPATDGKWVYVTFLERTEMVVVAYDFDGKQQWLVRPGAFRSMHGFCSAPILFQDKVIVNGDHDGESYLVALDRASGRTLWKISRANKTRSYCAPIIRTLAGRTQMILSGDKCVASYNPHDGKRHWIIDGPTDQFVASLVYSEKHNLLFCTGGFPELHILAIRPDGMDNVTQSHIAWRTTKGVSYVPSPVAVGDYFFNVSDGGVASCFDAATGKIFWQERLGGKHWASLVTAEGRVYFLSESGVMTIVKAAPQFEVLARNELGETCYASPAISNGQIFLRGDTHLYCIGKSD